MSLTAERAFLLLPEQNKTNTPKVSARASTKRGEGEGSGGGRWKGWRCCLLSSSLGREARASLTFGVELNGGIVDVLDLGVDGGDLGEEKAGDDRGGKEGVSGVHPS